MQGGHWRGHVDNPFDQFGLLEIRRRIVAAFELGAREAVAVFERRDLRRRRGGHLRGSGPGGRGGHGRWAPAWKGRSGRRLHSDPIARIGEGRRHWLGVLMAAAGCRSSRTRRIAWSATSAIVYSTPSCRNEAPGSGNRPRAWKAKPPTVRKSP